MALRSAAWATSSGDDNLLLAHLDIDQNAALSPYNGLMLLLRKLSAACFLFAGTIGFASTLVAQQSEMANGRVVLVLPFENRSGNTSLNWIGDSFPDTLDHRLSSAGFLTISQDDRMYAYHHLGLPEGFRPSRATSIRVAQQLDADYIIIGSFNVSGNQISVQAKAVSVDQFKLSTPVINSADLSRLFDAENAIAWQVARAIDPSFNVAEATFLSAPGAVPLPAFEDYIRGDNAIVPAERIQRLKEAVAFQPDYAAALLALGKEQYLQRDFAGAAATLSKLPPSNPLALEGEFYLGLSRFNSANYAGAETAFSFVADHLPLPEVINNEAVSQSRQGKDAVTLLQRASTADPSDEDYHYNLTIALFRRGDTAGALHEVEAALKLKPNDNEALQLQNRLRSVSPGSRLTADTAAGFSPVERIRRTYSETSYRQAAFQLDQLRAARLATLSPQQRASEYNALGRDALNQGMLPEAEARFQSALSADAHSALALAGIARVREASGDTTQARTEAMASLRLQPNADALLVLARLDMAKSALPIAAGEVSQALQLEPGNTAAQALRGTLQSRGQAIR